MTKPHVEWSDPEVRKDVAIVVGLFAFGLLVCAALGFVAIWLLDLVGWWPETRAGTPQVIDHLHDVK